MEPADGEIEDGRTLPVGELGRIAADRRADDGKNSRTDDRADTKRGQRDRAEGLLESVLRTLGLGDELVDGLFGEDLTGQRTLLKKAGNRG